MTVSGVAGIPGITVSGAPFMPGITVSGVPGVPACSRKTYRPRADLEGAIGSRAQTGGHSNRQYFGTW